MSKKKFVWSYLKNSPWYMWVIRITGAILIAYIITNALNLK